MTTEGYRLRNRGRPAPKDPVLTGNWYQKVGSEWQAVFQPTSVLVSPGVPYSYRESTEDEVHRWPAVKTGGPFRSVKITLPHDESHGVRGFGSYDTGTSLVNGYVQRYVGGFLPIWNIAGDELTAGSYTGNLFASNLAPSPSSYIPQVYPRLRPQLASAGAAVFIAELRDLPRMLRTTARGFSSIWNGLLQAGDFRYGAPAERLRRLRRTGKMAPKELADHFLNEQFGWLPFLSDLTRFTKTFIHEGDKLHKLTRENNTWIKRRWVHEDEVSDTEVASGEGFVVNPQGDAYRRLLVGNLTSSAKWSVRKVVKTLVWSEGSFKYYRPEFDITRGDHFSRMMHVRRLMTLYGFRVNPSVVYEATPWSWAIDYVTNIGDHVDRFTDYAVDGVVARYMYLMHHRVSELVLTQTLNTKTHGAVSMSWTRKLESKQRVKADSPYGFTLPWDTLTPRQLAIAGAMGLSRMRW